MSGGTFQSGSVWMKAGFVLITVGLVVWLDAGSVGLVTTNSSLATAYEAFLIIGVCSYFLAVMLNFLYLFVEGTGSSVVLIVGLVFAFIAGFSAIIVLGIGRTIQHSDRMAYSAVCAIVSAIFSILQLRSSPS
ncbi:hypothetical protein BOX15_Mlig027149g1 [Macrostomum lignano]|uniref:MARVEL domain-containing protein n=1 Tax=Macrostomum lignano TaxID=282301 RepID=A0A267EED7_9PLAT|nr:hypothetical protein BOX15_Mlig027149g1 [Macrostomum lignano]